MKIVEVEFTQPVALSGCGQHRRVEIEKWSGSGQGALRIVRAELNGEVLEVERSDGERFLFPAVGVMWVRPENLFKTAPAVVAPPPPAPEAPPSTNTDRKQLSDVFTPRPKKRK